MHVVTSSVATLNLAPNLAVGASDLTYIAVPVRIAAASTPCSPMPNPPSPFLVHAHAAHSAHGHAHPPPPAMFHPQYHPASGPSVSQIGDLAGANSPVSSMDHRWSHINNNGGEDMLLAAAASLSLGHDSPRACPPGALGHDANTQTSSLESLVTTVTAVMNNNDCDNSTTTSAETTTAVIDAIEYIDVSVVAISAISALKSGGNVIWRNCMSKVVFHLYYFGISGIRFTICFED